PSVFSPSVFSATEIAQAFSTAQTRSIVAASITPGTGDELAVANTWNRTGYFYARVTGRGSAFSTSVPFTLAVTKGATTCTGVTDTAITTQAPQPASGLKTVIVTDASKVALDAVLPGPSGATLRDKLTAFAARSEVAGILVDVSSVDRVKVLRAQAAANPACPFAKNLVAEEIKGIVDSYRANPLRYVVIVGNDDAVPFFRVPDQSRLGQESGYVPPVQSNSPSESSLRLDFVLSQDRYGSKTTISLPWNDFPVPGLAVGRLVETASEIAGMIDAYAATNAVVSPKSSLVTGYDFLEDAANAVKTELDAGIGAAGDTLITPNGTSPHDPAAWTASQLRPKLFGARHDVIFLAGQFSANSALAADFETSILTTDLAASTTDFSNSIVFSAGCHAGYNLVDGDAIPGVTLALDWVQAFSRKGATLVAGTGYQYGDTDFLEYSERLYRNFAQQLRAGPAGSAVPLGEALVQAKLGYLAATPDIRGLHEKALLEATLFGLPMLGVNMPSGRGTTPGTGPAISPAPVTAGPASTLGLRTKDVSVAPNLESHTATLKNLRTGTDIKATWLSGPDGVMSKPAEPALPLAVVNVTPDDATLVLRGVGYRGGKYADSTPLFPFSGAPTTETRSAHVSFLSPVHYPATMWTPNYFGALAGNGGTQLLVTPVQHKAANVADGTSTQRRHTDIDLRLYYSANLSQAALSDAPIIVSVDAQADAGAVAFTGRVIGDPAAAIHQVWITYTGDGTNAWAPLDLEQCVRSESANLLPAACGAAEDSRLWMGRLASPPANLKYFAQAVSGVGLVARDDNAGAYFALSAPTPTATAIALISPPQSATVGDSLNVTAKLAHAGGTALGGKMVSVSVGGAAQLGTTGSDGTVTVKMPIVAAAGSYQITAAFAGDEIFGPSSTTSPLALVKVTPTPTPVSPSVASAGINVTAALGGTTTAPQQIPVAFTVTGPGGTTTIYAITDESGNATLPPPSGLPAGTYTVTQASFGGDATYAPTTIALSQQFVVPKMNQSISFAALPDKMLGDPDFAVFATASSGLAVTFGASGACTLAGSTVHLTGAGSCTITADQPGDANTNPALQVARSFSIGSAFTVAALVRAVPSPTMADSVTYTLTFSEAVTGVATGNFTVTTSGIAAASVASVNGSGATWTVTVNTGRGNGTLRLD
ncbi:MAG: C25 family cysteine peptidase, partial [Casimicrobiaceae bacterium]